MRAIHHRARDEYHVLDSCSGRRSQDRRRPPGTVIVMRGVAVVDAAVNGEMDNHIDAAGSRTSTRRHVASETSPLIVSIAMTFFTAVDAASRRTSSSPMPCAAPVT